MYMQRYTYFKIKGRHFWFPTSGFSPFGRTTLPPLPLNIAGPQKHGYSRWSCIAILYTSWDIRISNLEATILDFTLPVSPRSVVQRCHYSHCIAGPRKYTYSRLNYNAILYTSWDIRISSSETAILDFPLPVSPCLVAQHCHYSHRIAGPRKHRYSRWNCIAILYTSWDIRISSSHAAILDSHFRFLPVWSYNIATAPTG